MQRYRTVPYEVWSKRNKATNPRLNLTNNLTIDVIESFCSKITRHDKCWIFQSKTTDTYIRFRGMLAHRVSYELFVGELPRGMTLDHLCMVKQCVNPGHLEPVTVYENSKRYTDYQKSGVKAVPMYAI